MELQGLSEEKVSFGESSIPDLCQKAIEVLDQAFEVPIGELESKVDQVERIVLGIRDRLIAQARATGQGPEHSRLRKSLEQVNIAVTLLAGVEYPASGIQRNYMEQAKKTLKNIQEDIAGVDPPLGG